jgi:hypothetical protein
VKSLRRLPFDSLFAAPARLGDIRVLALDGPSGAGKSTLAAKVVEGLRERGAHVELVASDDFATWSDPVSWWPRLVDGVLEPLSHRCSGRYRKMDWTNGDPCLGAFVEVAVPEILVLEGVSVGRASLRPRLSGLWWVDGLAADERLERAVARDGEGARESLKAWQRFERGWFAADDTRSSADCVLHSAEMP